ncbi:S49 family peptidase, partial [Pseudomonas shirazensis]
MADEWKAPETEVVESEDRKSWKLLEKTLLAGVQEQRRARRWGIFFKLLTFLYLFGILFLFSPLMSMDGAASRSGSHTALVEVRGVIADQEAASADNLIKSLREAFKDANTKAVVMRINSP